MVIKRKGYELDIQGLGESNGHISNLMRNMAKTDILGEPKLSVIKVDKKQKEASRMKSFYNLSVKQLQRD